MFPKRRRLSKVEESPSPERKGCPHRYAAPRSQYLTAPRARANLLMRLATTSEAPLPTPPSPHLPPPPTPIKKHTVELCDKTGCVRLVAPKRTLLPSTPLTHTIELGPVKGKYKAIAAAYRVNVTPGGSIRTLPDDMPVVGVTPGGSVRHVKGSPDSSWDPVKRIPEGGLPTELRANDPQPGPGTWYVARWLRGQEDSGVSGDVASGAPVRAESPVASPPREPLVLVGPLTSITGTVDEPVLAKSPVAGPSSEPVVLVEPPTMIPAAVDEQLRVESPVAGAFDATFHENSSAGAPENSNDGSELDLESDDDEEVDENPYCFAPAIGAQELAEEFVEEANIGLAETDQIMDEVHGGLPDIDIGFEWTEDFSTFRGKKETFTAGTSERAAFYDTPYEAFVAYWDESIMRHIATETNRYAEQTIDGMVENGNLKMRARVNEWCETNMNELYVLFGLFIIMGYSPRLSLCDYWSTNTILNMPGFREIMSYNKFILLNKFLHFVNNEDLASYNDAKLSKLQPIIDHLNRLFERLYELGEHISIDESLTLWKGRLSWAQCIRSKVARFGIKSFELCDSKTGYLWRFVIYTGKSSTGTFEVPIRELAGKSTAIVLQLLCGLEGKGYYLTMDNYYNSPLLARYLKSRGFDCVGTLRPNRKHVPDAVKIKKSVEAGTIAARHSGDVCVLAWKDSKVVTTISTFHDTKTFVGRKAGKALTKPVMVRDYNKYMGGVDLKDQKLAMYLVERKRCVKWYMKMFKRLLNVSVHNAYVLHRRTLERRNQPLMRHRDFRKSLAEALVSRHRTSVPKIRRPRFAEKRLQADLVHVPDKSARRRCARCSALGMYKRSTISCTTCDVGLCLGRCWKEYHSETDLKKK